MFQKKHLHSKGFWTGVWSSSEDRYEVITTYEAKEEILIREKLWSGNKGENGTLVNEHQHFMDRVRGACKEYWRIQKKRSEVKGLWC